MTDRSNAPTFLLVFLGIAIFAMLAVPVKEMIAEKDDHSHADGSNAGPQSAPSESAPPESAMELSDEQAQTLASLMQKIKNNPNDAEALTAIGDAFISAKEWTRAEAFLTRAALARPGDVTSRHMLALSQYRQHKMVEAAATFEEILNVQSDDARALYNLAVIRKYHLNGQAEATKLFEKIIALPGVDEHTASKAREELETPAPSKPNQNPL